MIFLLMAGTTTYEAKSQNVGTLLGSITRERIIVPQFQRGYEWGEKQVRAFWKDIIEFSNERTDINGPKAYFFGPVVILERNNEIHLLDGQQRLATVTILLSVLRDVGASLGSANAENFAKETQAQFIRKGEDGFALEMGDTDETYFREFIQEDGVKNVQSDQRTHRNIKNARDILYSSLKGHLASSTDSPAKLKILKELRQIIQSDLIIACISVQSDEEAFRIFVTLNDRGLALSAPDLLLTYLMRKAKNNQDRKTIRDLWTEMIETMDEPDFDDYMRQLWVSKFGDVKQAALFTVIKDHIDTKSINPVDFARDYADESDAYAALVRYDQSELGSAAGHIEHLLENLNADSAIPLLLAAKRYFVDQKNFTKLCQLLLVFVTRYAILGNQDRSGLENLLFSLARDVREKMSGNGTKPKPKEAQCLVFVKTALEGNAPTNEQIQARAEGIELSEKAAKYVLRKLANAIQTGNKEIQVGIVTVEHIFPKRPADGQWGGSANHAILEPYLDNIGNLTLLGDKLNSKKAKNLEYSEKKKVYTDETKILMTKNIPKYYKSWGEAEIKKRAKHLVDKALSVWNFTDLSKV